MFDVVRIITSKQQILSSDPVLIRQFSNKLQSDPVLIRPKLVSVLIQSDPVLIRAHLLSTDRTGSDWIRTEAIWSKQDCMGLHCFKRLADQEWIGLKKFCCI